MSRRSPAYRKRAQANAKMSVADSEMMMASMAPVPKLQHDPYDPYEPVPFFEGCPMEPASTFSPMSSSSASAASIYSGQVLMSPKSASIFSSAGGVFGEKIAPALPVSDARRASDAAIAAANRPIPSNIPRVTVSQAAIATGQQVSSQSAQDMARSTEASAVQAYDMPMDEEELAEAAAKAAAAAKKKAIEEMASRGLSKHAIRAMNAAPASEDALRTLERALQVSKQRATELMEEVDVAALALTRAARDACISKFSVSVRKAFKDETGKSGPLALKLHQAFKRLLDEHHAYMEIVREDRTRKRLAKKKEEVTEEKRKSKPKRGQDARGREQEIREAQRSVDLLWDSEYAKVCSENPLESPIGLHFVMNEYDGVMGRLKEAYVAAAAVPAPSVPDEDDEEVHQFVAPVSAAEMVAKADADAKAAQERESGEEAERVAMRERDRQEALAAKTESIAWNSLARNDLPTSEPYVPSRATSIIPFLIKAPADVAPSTPAATAQAAPPPVAPSKSPSIVTETPLPVHQAPSGRTPSRSASRHGSIKTVVAPPEEFYKRSASTAAAGAADPRAFCSTGTDKGSCTIS